MASSAAAVSYPSSGDYNVLVQRFKLLNLVQRVAHRDVSEMLDTVGLECLARKGTLSRWGWAHQQEEDRGDESGDGDRLDLRQFRGYGKYTARRSAQTEQRRAAAAPATRPGVARRSPRLAPAPARMAFGRSTSGFEAQLAAARWSSGVEEDSEEASGRYGVTRRVSAAAATPSPRTGGRDGEAATRRRYVVRRPQRVLRSTPEDREAFFARLAEPRERVGPVIEDVLIYDEADDGSGGAAGQPSRSGRPPERRGAAASEEGGYRSAAPGRPRVEHAAGFARGTASSDSRFYGSAAELHAHYRGGAASPHPHHRPSSSSTAAPPPPTGTAAEWAYDRDDGSDAHGHGGSYAEEGRGDVEAEEAYELPAALPPAPQRQPRQQPLAVDDSRGDYAAGPHEVDSTPPPRRLAPKARGAPAAAGAAGFGLSSPHGDGLVRRRSVNFTVDDDNEAGTHAAAAAAYAASPLSPTQQQERYGTSPVSAVGDDAFAATAPAAYAQAQAQSGGGPAVPQLRFPVASQSDLFLDGDESVMGSPGANGPGSGRGVGLAATAGSPSALRGRSVSNISGLPKSPRVGRGLAPKAKPKGAVVEAGVPVEAVRHAAALVTRSASTPASRASPATSTPGNSYPAAHKSPALMSAHSVSGILQSPRSSFKPAAAAAEPASFPEAPLSPQAELATPVSAAQPFSPPAIAAGEALATAAAVGSGAGDAGGGYPVNEAAQQSFQAVSSRVDSMLQNLQHVLHRVLKDGDGTAAHEAVARPAGTDSGEGPYESSFCASSNEGSRRDADAVIEVDLDDDTDAYSGGGGERGVDDNDYEEEEEEEDEMLLYTRIQQRVSRLGAEMHSVAQRRPDTNSGGEDGDESATPELAHLMTDARPPAPLSGRPRRVRGEVPDAVVQRLCAYRMDHFQYIAYNERLWNSSTTSQFVFAQRLTAALLEECWSEVMAEVDANLSEYVEGLVDHELQ